MVGEPKPERAGLCLLVALIQVQVQPKAATSWGFAFLFDFLPWNEGFLGVEDCAVFGFKSSQHLDIQISISNFSRTLFFTFEVQIFSFVSVQPVFIYPILPGQPEDFKRETRRVPKG